MADPLCCTAETNTTLLSNDTSGPITSWQIHGETVETVRQFIFYGSKITADGGCSHEIKRLASWKKSYIKPRQSNLNSRNVHIVKAMVFPVVMYGCETWNIKKVEHRRKLVLNCGVGDAS